MLQKNEAVIAGLTPSVSSVSALDPEVIGIFFTGENPET